MRDFVGVFNSFAHNHYETKIWLHNDFGSIITSLGEKYAKTVSSQWTHSNLSDFIHRELEQMEPKIISNLFYNKDF
jgi:hypothetical protein